MDQVQQQVQQVDQKVEQRRHLASKRPTVDQSSQPALRSAEAPGAALNAKVLV
jgi:hypothetical protein